MSSRAAAALRTASLQGYRRCASTAAAGQADGTRAKGKSVAEYVPVYVALGMISLSVALGLSTARQQLAHAPNVRLDKRKREAVAEVADPDLAIHDGERFVGSSLFRKVAHVQDDRSLAAGVADPVDDYPVRKAVTLKDVGVGPQGIYQQDREGVLGRIFKRNNTSNGRNEK